MNKFDCNHDGESGYCRKCNSILISEEYKKDVEHTKKV